MTRYLIVLAIFLSWSGPGFAQTTDAPANELNSTPPAPTTTTVPATAVEKTLISAGKPARKISYGLSAGTQFSRVWGTATYLEPSVLFPVTKRFSGFASLSMITTFGANRNFYGGDAFAGSYAPLRNQRYIVNAGGNYLVNDRLNLTGSIWRDLSKNYLPGPVNLLLPGGSNGLSIRANYKITDNLSVSGGFRYSNGNAYQNSWYHPASPYGF